MTSVSSSREVFGIFAHYEQEAIINSEYLNDIYSLKTNYFICKCGTTNKALILIGDRVADVCHECDGWAAEAVALGALPAATYISPVGEQGGSAVQ